MILNALKSRIKPIIIGILLLLIIGYFGASLFIANKLSTNNPKPVPIDKTEIAENGEDVEFLAPDGIKLVGWFFPRDDSEKVVILVHGHGETRANVFYGGENLAKFLLEENYNVFMYDTRGNGESQAARQTFGQNEGKDIIGAVTWLQSRGFEAESIGILATSLGAISTLVELNNLKVGAIIVDSPAAEMEPIITREMINVENVPELLVPGVYFMAKAIFGIDIYSIRPIDNISRESKFLIFHSENDPFIPVENSKRILEKSSEENKLVIFQNSDHIKGFIDHPELYKEEVLNYLEQELK